MLFSSSALNAAVFNDLKWDCSGDVDIGGRKASPVEKWWRLSSVRCINIFSVDLAIAAMPRFRRDTCDQFHKHLTRLTYGHGTWTFTNQCVVNVPLQFFQKNPNFATTLSYACKILSYCRNLFHHITVNHALVRLLFESKWKGWNGTRNKNEICFENLIETLFMNSKRKLEILFLKFLNDISLSVSIISC